MLSSHNSWRECGSHRWTSIRLIGSLFCKRLSQSLSLSLSVLHNPVTFSWASVPRSSVYPHCSTVCSLALNMCGWLLMKMKIMMMMMTTTIRWECASCKSSKEADRKSTEKGETAEWPKVIAESPVKFCGDLGEAEEMWGPCMLSKPKIDQHPNGHTFFCWTSWIFSCCSHRQKSRWIPWALRIFFPGCWLALLNPQI